MMHSRLSFVAAGLLAALAAMAGQGAAQPLALEFLPPELGQKEICATPRDRAAPNDPGRPAAAGRDPLPQPVPEHRARQPGLDACLREQQPHEAAVEETFVNKDPVSTLKLGQARGVALLAPARLGLPVGEYAANQVKKTVVGVGHADKRQVQAMVKVLLPRADFKSADEADALAIAICHAHQRTATLQRVASA